MKRAIVVLVSLAVLLAVLASCKQTTSTTTLIPSPITTPTTTASASDISAQIGGNNAFTFDLYQKVKESGNNLFYSPYSISTALAMTYAGARGNTSQQMAQALHFVLPDGTLHSALFALQQDLTKRNNSDLTQLSVANALWGQKDYRFLSAYLKLINDRYNGAFRSVDFVKAAEAARQEINRWVSDQTKKKIEELIKPGSVDPSTVLVITNAVYLKAPWQAIFRSDTADEPFYKLDGQSIMVPMMKHDVWHYNYARGENYRTIELKYKDSDLSMLLLVPDSGQFANFENSLDNGRFQSILQSMQDTALVLRMPKFKFGSEYLLNDYLKALGMVDAFSNADFSGMSDSRDLFISQILHGASISVDENGTEASAGTAVIIARGGAETVVIDRPFIFLIRDNKTGTILFAGRVLDPNVEQPER